MQRNNTTTSDRDKYGNLFEIILQLGLLSSLAEYLLYNVSLDDDDDDVNSHMNREVNWR